MLFGKTCPNEGSSTVQSSLHRDPSCHRDLSKLALRLIMSSFVSSVADSSSNWAVCGKSSGLVSMPVATGSSQKMQIEVMPLFAGHLPYPRIKVLKYLPHTSGVFNQPDPGMLHCGFCVNCWLFEKKKKKKVHSNKRWNRKLKLNPLFNVLRQLHGERQFVPAGWPGGHGKHPQPGQCALCGQQRPSAEGDSDATVGLIWPWRGVQPQPHAAGPGATCHRWPHHGGQRHMMSPVQRWTGTLNGLRCSLGAWVPESLADTAVSYQYGSHYWRRYTITD